jgi:hypothetical protein
MWLKSKLKIKNITLTRERRGNWRNCYILRINGFGCLPILNAIMPYLLIKKKNAILLKEYIESRLDQKWRESYTHRHHKIFLTIKKLNKKGKERNA